MLKQLSCRNQVDSALAYKMWVHGSKTISDISNKEFSAELLQKIYKITLNGSLDKSSS